MSRIAHDIGSDNAVRFLRLEQGLSQEQLASRAGLSRTEVSAIENKRVTPSVWAALALAHTLGCSVERLFTAQPSPQAFRWAGAAPGKPCRVWLSRDALGGLVAHRVERTHMGAHAHDAVWDGAGLQPAAGAAPERTLVLAGCDPAVGILAGPLAEHGIRLLPLIRSSRRALSLLQAGCVHAAGFHLGGSTAGGEQDNVSIARDALGADYRLMRIACWQEGLAVADGVAGRSMEEVLRRPLRWVGREEGSGAQVGLERLMAEYGVRHAPCNTATDHYGVAQSVAMGWADVGMCTRFVAEQAGLEFLHARHADYDMCWATAMDDDVRIKALSAAVRSRHIRDTIGSLAGYTTSCTGDTTVLGTV